PDLLSESWIDDQQRERIHRRGLRSVVYAPLLRGNQGIGVISVSRAVPGPFTDKQVALLQTFAAQAVIAIENARLFSETQEALEQQTATAEVLKVISSSPTDIQPVLDAVANAAARFCGAADVVIRRVEGDHVRVVAHVGPIPLSPDGGENRPISAGR